jgi:hypothetical protein
MHRPATDLADTLDSEVGLPSLTALFWELVAHVGMQEHGRPP